MLAKLTNQEIAPDSFSKKKNLQAASLLLPFLGCAQCTPSQGPALHFFVILEQTLPLPRSLRCFSFFLNCSMCAMGAKNVLFCAMLSAQDIVEN